MTGRACRYCHSDWGSALHNVDVQVLRSGGPWSVGTSVECSIYNAYIDTIMNAKRFIYIENQFFVSCRCVHRVLPTSSACKSPWDAPPPTAMGQAPQLQRLAWSSTQAMCAMGKALAAVMAASLSTPI